jgi:hypothetical protein
MDKFGRKLCDKSKGFLLLLPEISGSYMLSLRMQRRLDQIFCQGKKMFALYLHMYIWSIDMNVQQIHSLIRTDGQGPILQA